MSKRALITGITGQDGSYMAEQLVDDGWDVYGIVRRSSIGNLGRIEHPENINLMYGDLLDTAFIHDVLASDFDVIYNFAAQSHVHASYSIPTYTYEVNANAVFIMLETLVQNNNKHTKFYQASTSEMFGNNLPPQGLNTPFSPQSPYALSKLSAHEIVKYFRNVHDMFAVSGILFNHESPRRGIEFVTKKIASAVGYFSKGNDVGNLKLGFIDSMRDWGYAPEYVSIIHNVMMDTRPRDFVLGTGEMHTVKEFLERAFQYAGLDWKLYTEYDTPSLLRPAEVYSLCADSTFEVEVKFDKLVELMVQHELDK